MPVHISFFKIIPEVCSPSYSVKLSVDTHFIEYLKYLKHGNAVCDRCVDRIQGKWFRCAYCPKDLCETCEALDTHNDTHFFVVFKSDINMNVLKWAQKVFLWPFELWNQWTLETSLIWIFRNNSRHRSFLTQSINDFHSCINTSSARQLCKLSCMADVKI